MCSTIEMKRKEEKAYKLLLNSKSNVREETNDILNENFTNKGKRHKKKRRGIKSSYLFLSRCCHNILNGRSHININLFFQLRQSHFSYFY